MKSSLNLRGKIFSFAHPFSRLRQSVFPVYLGVDIGTTSIKMVEVKPGKQLPQLVNYALLDGGSGAGRMNSALQTSNLKLFDQDIVELLTATVRQMKTSARTALATVPPFSAFLTVLTFPEMSATELSKAIEYQVRQYVPLPLSEIVFDWRKVYEYEDERGYRQQQILVISVPQEQIHKYQHIFSRAGLHLKTLEIESLSIIRSLIGTDPTPTVIIDIGSRSTNIVFAEKGQLRMSSQSDYGGATLTESVASSLNINQSRAEELKREKGIVGIGADYELSTIMLPFLDVIINEVKTAYAHYQSQFPAAPAMERAILSGGGANLKGIEKYFKRELELGAVVKATPLTRFEYDPSLEPMVGDLNSLLGLALGVALQEF